MNKFNRILFLLLLAARQKSYEYHMKYSIMHPACAFDICLSPSATRETIKKKRNLCEASTESLHYFSITLYTIFPSTFIRYHDSRKEREWVRVRSTTMAYGRIREAK